MTVSIPTTTCFLPIAMGGGRCAKLLTLLVGIVVSLATKEEHAGKLSPTQAARIRAKAKRLLGK
jgi:hypothetical protein